MKNKKLIITTAVIVAILAVVGVFFANKYIKKYNQEKQEEQRIANELQSAKEELINYINNDEFIADKESYISKVDTISVIDELSPIRTEYDEAISEAKELANAKNEAISKLEELSHVDTDTYKEQIENGSSIEDIESLISEANSEEESEAEAERQRAEAEAERQRAEAERQQAERQQAENSNNSNNSNNGAVVIDGGIFFIGGVTTDTPTSSGNHELEVPPGFTTGKGKDTTGDNWEVDPNDQGGIIFK